MYPLFSENVYMNIKNKKQNNNNIMFLRKLEVVQKFKIFLENLDKSI